MYRRFLLTVPVLAGLAACASLTNPTSAPETVVFFTADSAALDDAAKATISQAAANARANPGLQVRVLGFAAPDSGTAAFNRSLAQARAQVVADALTAAGVPSNRVRLGSRGAVPFDMMPTESRRVEIRLGT